MCRALNVPCTVKSPVLLITVNVIEVMKAVKLSARLRAISEFIDDGASVADIGTDHGLLPVYLAQTGLAGRIFASDISAASLDAAYRSASEYNVTDLITFIAAPGLDGISPAEVDTIIIAGLGGETILSMLTNASWTKDNGIKLILQPQSKVDLLCRFLYDHGYSILETKSVIDRSKKYTIIHAMGGYLENEKR